ncbi:MAG TPA: cation transporter [Edaphobacter sp.]|nr:cation transporter [Edaphobacter sp.]
MSQPIPITESTRHCAPRTAEIPGIVLGLQGITLAWMLVESVIALYAAYAAQSAALLAFGADSLVELLSASVALLSFVPSFPLTKERAARFAGILLFALAGIVAIMAALSLMYDIRPEVSYSGIAITIAALIVMPVLAWLKRKVARMTNNRALAADAVQSATCAYLAAITLFGLAVNAVFHIRWVDSVAALAALPILIVEGLKAVRGESCSCW